MIILSKDKISLEKVGAKNMKNNLADGVPTMSTKRNYVLKGVLPP